MSGGGRIGVDVGGTFTDVVAVEDGTIHIEKVPSIPASPDEGVGAGLDALDSAIRRSEVDGLVHGTTVATNAVLEGEWAETALVTTEGFRDVLEIGRQDRPDIYDLHAVKPEPIVSRDRRYGIPERLDERGDELQSFDADDVATIADEIEDGPAESVAVCLLFAFEDDAHERATADALRERGVNGPITLSSAVHPEIREYERTVVTAMNAALVPVMDDYLGALERRLHERDIPATPMVMTSSGGSMTADAARERPVRTVLSGPAAGVRGAAHVAERAGYADLITMDMGGTSCDVSVVADGEPLLTTDARIGEYPIGIPSVDIETVGAGGGSIARVDSGGALRVGPASAGADPGPVCYGRGGERPTTTDAHALLNRIAPERIVGEPADPGRVRSALQPIAEELDRSLEETAAGVIRVANANMERALRVMTVERGRDPRSLTLVAFGGAGPLHAAQLAGNLDIPRVLIPPAAGVLSALGLLASDVVYDTSRSRIRRWEAVEPSELEAIFDELESTGQTRLRAAGVPSTEREFERSVALRYVGQSFTVRVPVPGALDAATMDTIADRFHDAHEREHGHAAPDEPIELETLRVRSRGRTATPDLDSITTSGRLATARRGTRTVGFGGTTHETMILERRDLGPGVEFNGPAIVAGAACTVAVPPDHHARIDPLGSIVIEVES